MKTVKILNVLLSVAIALPMALSAQTDVNREKYPDYSDIYNPDRSLLESSTAQRAAQRAATERPEYVNNAEEIFFPPVFNQDGGSCGSASRICYMFTYELNAYRNLYGKFSKNLISVKIQNHLGIIKPMTNTKFIIHTIINSEK